MAYQTPPSLVAFQKLTASYLNTYLVNNMEALANDTPAWISISRTTSDFSKTSDTTLEDVPGLSFAIAASEVWAFIVFGGVTAAVTADVKLGVTGPSGATASYATPNHHGGTNIHRTASIGTGIEFQTGDSAPEEFNFSGMVVNSTNAGTVQVQAAQFASSGTATTIYANSFIIALRLS